MPSITTVLILLLGQASVSSSTVFSNDSAKVLNGTIRIGFLIDAGTQSLQRWTVIEKAFTAAQADGIVPGLNLR